MKYHITKSGQPGVCKAKKLCPLGGPKDHYSSPEEARKAFESKHSPLLQRQGKRAPFSKTILFPKIREVTSDSLEYSAQSIADLEYTYGPPGYYCECDPDDYCRCYVYQTIEATKIHFDKVMEILTHRKSTEIPESLKEVGRQVGLDKPESFRFYGSPDYYGEVLDGALYAPETVNKAFQKWHSQNCVDSKDTARAFLYGQGVDSRGKNTLGLVKDFLQKENPGRTSKLVEEAKHVRGGTIPLRDVLIPATHHLERVEAREPKAQRGEPVIQGIVVERDGRYHLVDGYHRHKWATERGKKSGTYLILS